MATKFTQLQTNLPLRQWKEYKQRTRKRSTHSEKLSEEWKLLPGKYSFTIDPQLRDILDNVALYDVKRCQNAGKLFCRIVDDPLLTQMIHHAHLHRLESFEATSTFGIRTALIFLAQRIHYFSCRVASACPVAWKGI